MAAKRIQVSTDGGTTYRTLPGAKGDYKEQLNVTDDTIFGQSWKSDAVSISQWQVTGNAYFKGVAGYQANIKQQGVSTTMTAEACTLVSGKTYQITNATKRVIDYFSPLTVFDNSIDQTAQVASIDYLNGLVTFATGYTVVGPVTVTGKYLPMTTIANGRQFTLTQTSAEIDQTVYENARTNGGWRSFGYGLRTVSLAVTGLYNITNGFSASLAARSPVVVEIAPNNDELTICRGYFKFQDHTQQGNVGALEEELLTLGLWVPDGALLVNPFSWYFDPTSTLNLAVQNAIGAWQAGTIVNVNYQNDPSVSGSGHTGQAIVTEATLSNTFDGLNDFAFSFRGTGAPTLL